MKHLCFSKYHYCDLAAVNGIEVTPASSSIDRLPYYRFSTLTTLIFRPNKYESRNR